MERRRLYPVTAFWRCVSPLHDFPHAKCTKGGTGYLRGAADPVGRFNIDVSFHRARVNLVVHRCITESTPLAGRDRFVGSPGDLP